MQIDICPLSVEPQRTAIFNSTRHDTVCDVQLLLVLEFESKRKMHEHNPVRSICVANYHAYTRMEARFGAQGFSLEKGKREKANSRKYFYRLFRVHICRRSDPQSKEFARHSFGIRTHEFKLKLIAFNNPSNVNRGNKSESNPAEWIRLREKTE